MRSGVLRLLLSTWACALVAAADPVGPITTHFEEWLKSNGYGEFDYARRDLGEVGSYGGKQDDHQEVQQTPIVFIHGNTDGALKEPGPYSSGSSAQIAYFESKGYTQAELYVTTWGNRRLDEAAYQAHNCSTLVRLRRFVEAVLKYTGKKAIHLSGHSMGVTLARKVAKGGKVTEKFNGNTCDLGPPLTEQIDVFLGLCGANYGMCACLASTYTCNEINGFWPGDSCGSNDSKMCGVKPLPEKCDQQNYSSLLYQMNNDGIREGQNVYALWTTVDDVVIPDDKVWGKYSSRFPTTDWEKAFTNYTHMQVKELTVDLQYGLFTHNRASRP
ncbi:unnamed protein product, partial [Mesorhabditis spiculigera]